MSANSLFGKILRWFGIVLMGLTAGFTLMGGIGTSCVAINPNGFSETMAKLAPFQWLYILFVLVGIGLGILGIRATYRLAIGAEKSYSETLIVLAAGTLIGMIHMNTSRALRGASMPVDAVVYMTILTLIVFLIFRLPPVWQGVNFTRGDAKTNGTAGGAAAILLGLFALSIQYWMAPSHTWGGVNYAGAFNLTMTVIGAGCLIFGVGVVMKRFGVKVNLHREIFGNKATLEQ